MKVIEMKYLDVDFKPPRALQCDVSVIRETVPFASHFRRCNSAVTLSHDSAQRPLLETSLPIMARLKVPTRRRSHLLKDNNDDTIEEADDNCLTPEETCLSDKCTDFESSSMAVAKLSTSEPATSLEVFMPENEDRAKDDLSPRQSFQPEDKGQTHVRDNVVIILSGMYGLVLAVLGLVIPITQSFLGPVQPIMFEMYYVYLYTLSVSFLVYVYLFLLHDRSLPLKKFASAVSLNRGQERCSKDNVSRTFSSGSRRRRRFVSFTENKKHDTGSFYLRLGAVGFGIGSMILDGLYVGQFLETQATNTTCQNTIQAVRHLSKFLFTFTQLYFIFRNSKMCIKRFPYIARFGLMHMSVTNVCVWLRSIVEETLHSFHTKDPDLLEVTKHLHQEHAVNNISIPLSKDESHDVTSTCQWSNLIGNVLKTATPYLYPFSIEYSLICAGVLYVMWNNVGGQQLQDSSNDDDDDDDDVNTRHKMSIDCAGSSRGLFLGILAFVGTVISLIVFYVIIQNRRFSNDVILIVHVSEITMYSLALTATVAAGVRMRNLHFRKKTGDNLEQNLILISLAGLYMFSFFSILAGIIYIRTLEGSMTIINNLVSMTQATLQAMFMFAGLRMSAANNSHAQNKNGRELVTFLLIINFSLWLINTFETQKSAHNPLQMKVYGHKAWAVFTHISVPLGIFFRFHSTVCLSNIWKHAWKIKNN